MVRLRIRTTDQLKSQNHNFEIEAKFRVLTDLASLCNMLIIRTEYYSRRLKISRWSYIKSFSSMNTVDWCKIESYWSCYKRINLWECHIPSRRESVVRSGGLNFQKKKWFWFHVSQEKWRVQEPQTPNNFLGIKADHKCKPRKTHVLLQI